MVAIKIPEAVKLVTDRIKNSDLGVSYWTLTSIVAFYLLGCRSLSDCVRSCAFSPSVSTLSNGMRSIPPGRLLRRVRKKLLRKLNSASDNSRFIYVLDDTANPKYGRLMHAVSMWGNGKSVYKGQRVLVLAVVDLKTKNAWPISFMITDKKESKSMLDHAADLVEQALGEGFPQLTVVSDSWFSSVKFMEAVGTLGCEYVGEIKCNRKAKSNPGPHVAWASLLEVFRGVKRQRISTPWDNKNIRMRRKVRKTASTLLLQIKGRRSLLKATAVYNRWNDRKPFAYYISTDRSLSGAKIWELSRARWSIECIFRTCKQNLSFGKLSCKGERAANLAVELPLYLYASIVQEPQLFGGTSEDSVDMILSKIRATSVEDTISLAIGGQKRSSLESLRVRRDANRASRKPLVTVAADEQRVDTKVA